MVMYVTRLLAVAAGAALVALPAAASAQAPRPPAGDETIRGTIQSLPSHYTLLLHDVRGFVDNVTLRDDTVLNPDGLALNSGVAVTIIGHVDGHTFDADEIDGPRDAVEAPPNDGGAPPYAAQGRSRDRGWLAMGSWRFQCVADQPILRRDRQKPRLRVDHFHPPQPFLKFRRRPKPQNFPQITGVVETGRLVIQHDVVRARHAHDKIHAGHAQQGEQGIHVVLIGLGMIRVTDIHAHG